MDMGFLRFHARVSAAGRRPLRLRAGAAAVAAVLAAPLLAGCGGSSGSAGPAASATARPSASPSSHAFAGLERRYGAHLGVYALDTGSGRTVAYHSGERFAHCSVSKALAAAVLLDRSSDAQLDAVVHYRSADLLEWAPVTSKHVATGMTLRALIAAALDQSDNTAANLLLRQLGGPAGLQKELRARGDRTTHTDRTEPTLNANTPGDVRDTSTPQALAADLRAFALGGVLPAARRSEYNTLLEKNTTGGPYIRAGVPSGWTVGDKTGNGGYGARNDLAVVRPPHGKAPIVLAVLSRRGAKDAKSDDGLIAAATRVALAGLR